MRLLFLSSYCPDGTCFLAHSTADTVVLMHGRRIAEALRDGGVSVGAGRVAGTADTRAVVGNTGALIDDGEPHADVFGVKHR